MDIELGEPRRGDFVGDLQGGVECGGFGMTSGKAGRPAEPATVVVHDQEQFVWLVEIAGKRDRVEQSAAVGGAEGDRPARPADEVEVADEAPRPEEAVQRFDELKVDTRQHDGLAARERRRWRELACVLLALNVYRSGRWPRGCAHATSFVRSVPEYNDPHRQNLWHVRFRIPEVTTRWFSVDSNPMVARSTSRRSDVEALVGPSATNADEVGGLAARDAGVEPAMLGEYMRAVIDVARSGQRLSPVDVETCHYQGEEAANQGVALSAVLDLYLSATWRLWADIDTRAPQSSAATVGSAAAAMFRAADDAAQALAAGYERAQRRTIRFEESLRREFIDDLLAGSGEPDLMLERAARFGFNLAGTHHVVVAQTGRQLLDAGPVHSRLEAHVLATFNGRDVMVATKQGLLVCVLPGAASDAATGLTRSLEETGEGPWRIGVGRPGRGSGGLVRSYSEACQSLELAGRLARSGSVARFEELLPYRVLTADTALVGELVEAVLGPLQRARGGAQHLIETLEAYIAASGNLSATARVLHLSPRAVDYRLQRITQLTGHSPQDPEGRFVLELAVRARPLIATSESHTAVPTSSTGFSWAAGGSSLAK